MIGLARLATEMSQLIPGKLASVSLAGVPDVAAAAPLAAMLGADAGALSTAAANLGRSRETIERTLSQGSALIDAARGELAALLTETVHRMAGAGLAALSPAGALSGAAGWAQLELIGREALAKAQQRLAHLARDLEPLAAELTDAAGLASGAAESLPTGQRFAAPNTHAVGIDQAKIPEFTQANNPQPAAEAADPPAPADAGANPVGAAAVAAAKSQLGTPLRMGRDLAGGLRLLWADPVVLPADRCRVTAYRRPAGGGPAGQRRGARPRRPCRLGRARSHVRRQWRNDRGRRPRAD